MSFRNHWQSTGRRTELLVNTHCRSRDRLNTYVICNMYASADIDRQIHKISKDEGIMHHAII